MNHYDYDISGNRTLEVDCDSCCSGVFEIQVADDRTVVGLPVGHCRCDRLQFEADYDSGMHADAIAAAITAADLIEADYDGANAQRMK